jgi:hypothetical protein
LAATQPDIPNQHIVEFHGLRTADLNGVRSSGSRRLNLHLPAAVDSRDRGCVFARNLNPDFVARFCPAQMVLTLPRCNTMLSPKIGLISGSDLAVASGVF